MGYNARNDEIRDNLTRMQRKWEAQRGAWRPCAGALLLTERRPRSSLRTDYPPGSAKTDTKFKDVRFWPIVDICFAPQNVRFWGKADMAIALRNVR